MAAPHPRSNLTAHTGFDGVGQLRLAFAMFGSAGGLNAVKNPRTSPTPDFPRHRESSPRGTSTPATMRTSPLVEGLDYN